MADGSTTSLANAPGQHAHPAWVCWLMPSVADLIFLALLFTLTCTALSMRLLGDAGIGWHIRTGQITLTTHSIPQEDPFSTQIHKPWVAWEWLYDVLVGASEKVAGLNGVVWLTALVIAIVFGWTFRVLIASGTNLLIALLLILLAISASMLHFLTRPHVFSWLFSLVWFWILSATERGAASRKCLWALPILMLIWVNIHGGFIFGFVLLAIFWLGSLWTWFRTDEDRLEDAIERIAAAKRARILFFVGLSSAAASLLNPYGWNLHAHIYSYLSNRFLMDHIEEFQSPNFHGTAQRCFLILLLVTVAALVARGRRFRLSENLVLLVLISSALYSSRNIPVASILLVLIVGPRIPLDDWGGRFFARMKGLELTLRGHLWPVLGAVLSLVVVFHHGRVGAIQLMDARFDPQRMPVAAVDYLAAHEFHLPVLTQDSWGGYVIYRLYPKTRVILDDRHDFYGKEFFESYKQMIEGRRDWEHFLTQHRPAVVLLPQNTALANLLRESSQWKIIYADDVSIIALHLGVE